MNSKANPSVSSPDEDSIVAEVEVEAPPHRVFKALTHQAELVQWFTDSKHPVHRWEIDARQGGRFRYFIDQETAALHKLSAFECHGEILEFDPPHLLVYTWIASWHEDKTRRTVVRWELDAIPGGTHVRVTHTGLANEPAARKDYGSGWLDVVKMLQSFLLEEGDVMTRPDISGIAPFFIVRNVPAALAYYRDRLGFDITFQGPAENDIFFGIVRRGRAMIMLKDVGVDPLPNCKREGGARWDAYLDVPDPDALAAEFSTRNVVFSAPLKDDDDGLRGFEVKDADGYVLFFGRPRA